MAKTTQSAVSEHARPANVRSTPRWPALDGVRAVAILAVLGVHAAIPHMLGGIVGVDIFFVLSGFLITSLLLREWDNRSAISLPKFYARRALRLFPALALAIVVALIVVALGASQGQGHFTLTGIPFVIFFVGNFARVIGGQHELGLLGVTWSLAVEEQFYLIWPFAVLLIVHRTSRRTPVALMLAALSVVDMVYRVALVRVDHAVVRVNFGGDARCDGLLMGCAVGFWLAGRGTRPFGAGARRALGVGTVIGILATVATIYAGTGTTEWTLEIGIPVAVVATALVVTTIVNSPFRPLEWVLRWPGLRWIGVRSYGLYLLHYPILVALHANGGGILRQLLGIGVSIVAAGLSYRWWETYWLGKKPRFQVDETAPVLPSVRSIAGKSQPPSI
jgi:peptidoglycan/LPS O-acetylase OafA/YrhL